MCKIVHKVKGAMTRKVSPVTFFLCKQSDVFCEPDNRNDNEFKSVAKWTQPLLSFRAWIRESFLQDDGCQNELFLADDDDDDECGFKALTMCAGPLLFTFSVNNKI